MADSYPNWFDKNKFKNILAIIDSKRFGFTNIIGEFKYIDIKDLLNNIKNNTINEISVKKGLNTLNQLKTAGMIKQKKRTPKQKELLNLFSNLFLIDKTLKSESQEDENENEKEKEKKKKRKRKIKKKMKMTKH